MKKCMRKLMCLTLVVLLVASMTVPVTAEVVSGSKTGGTYNYEWTITLEPDYGRAAITATTAPTTVKVQVQIETYYDLTGTVFSYEPVTASGYVNVSATDYAEIEEINQVPVRTVVSGVKAIFWVNGKAINEGNYAGDWTNTPY